MKNMLLKSTGMLAVAAFSSGVVQAKSEMRDFNELNWVNLGGGVEQAVIWGDPSKGASGYYFRLESGFEGIEHAHTNPYNGISIQGTWIHHINGVSKELPSGSHVFQSGSEYHRDSCKDTGVSCVLLIQQDEIADFKVK